MSGVVFLITDVLYGSTATAVATAGALIAFAVLWYAIPIWRRMRRDAGHAYVMPVYQAPNISAKTPSAGISTVR